MQDHGEEFSIAKMCNVLKVSKSGYYAWLKRAKAPLTEKQRQDKVLAQTIFQAFVKNLGVYGSPRIHAELQARQYHVSQKKVANMMRELGLKATPPKVKFTKKKQATPHASYENIVASQFKVGQINQVWVADITYIRTEEGWLYLATLMDIGSRKIVGWAMADHMETSLIKEALKHALSVRKPAKGWIHHSDQGSQYTSQDYTQLLEKEAAQISMSHKGRPGDNACMEAFHSTIKKECIYRQSIETIQEGKKLVEHYIVYFYNERRRHSSLGYLSPNQYERQLLQTTA
ncbi:IS3 family transposase [Lysinibacillus capsici]|uniref:IS3 family transposase n=1 Tax=Lysinibacillus TaxID=400634 RepID=UPI0027AB1802|nr:IS3 family transposase [Lysinibacillus boronitolerans]WHP43769.1 IS3 family transposase [Lysinibacillus boronitolerans]WHP43789.1 IS3 family transposase [Lysinibacillus boronitolerans]WHP43797.1 IS3 family transposase [Lysinibacillus boronitolerans]WHP43815.1 IS3 family transposase [Lysinibacillus boronitolerans]